MQGTSGMHQACAAAGGVAAVATLLVTLYTTVLPTRANDAVAAILPPLPAAEGGGVPYIGSAHVTGQVRLFLVAAFLVVLLTAVALAAGYYHLRWREGRAAARNRPFNLKLPLALLSIPALLCVVLAMQLAPTIFTPTNDTELARQLVVAAWATRSTLGGLGLGLLLLLAATALAAGVFYLIVMLPRRVITGRIERLLQ